MSVKFKLGDPSPWHFDQTQTHLASMTRGSPSKTPVVHQINVHKLNEINRESALATGKQDWAPVHSVTVGGVNVDLQVRVPAP